MKRISRCISLILCVVLAFNLCACSSENVTPIFIAPSSSDYWKGYEAPDINITEIDQTSDSNEDILNSLEGEESIYDLVYENIG